MYPALIKVTLFWLLMLAPVTLLALGPVAPYGQSPHPIFPSLGKVIRGVPGALDGLGEAVLHRSLATKGAVRLKNWFAYEKLGFVDAGDVISGREGWLFYKGDFESCYDEETAGWSMAHIDAMTDIAEAAGVELLVSMSPDKSVVYPEKLHPFARPYWHCKARTAAALRRAIARHAPRIVDHTLPLLASKQSTPERLLYYSGDTHWTPYGGALAMRQLLAAVARTDTDSFEPPRLESRSQQRVTDMRNNMLLLEQREPFMDVDASVEAQLKLPRATTENTVILRDSFYSGVASTLLSTFPGATFLHIDRDKKKHAAAVASADRVVVNSVERALIGRASNTTLSWSSPLAKALVARNVKRASGCTFPGPTTRVNAKTFNSAKSRLIVKVPPVQAAQLACVRLVLDVHAATRLELFLPRRGTDKTFERGRSIKMAASPGRRVVQLVLPAYLQGQRLRVDLGRAPGDVRFQSVEFGSIASDVSSRPDSG